MEYQSKEQVTKLPVVIIILVLGFVIFLFILNYFAGGQFFRRLVCAALFWVPYGALSQAFTQGCTAIPA